jgi:ABC-type lipoprotein release transport system permease subunit
MLHFIAAQFDSVMNFMSWAPHLAVNRLIAKWRSLVTIIIGVILGAGIGALIPLYSNAVGQIGMVQRLEDEPLSDAHAQLRISQKPEDYVGTLEDRVASVEDIVVDTIDFHISGDTLDSWVGDINPYIRTAKMGLLEDEETAVEGARASVLYLEGWEDHVRVVQGELPSEVEIPDGADFNVAISLTVANELALSPGDFIIVDQRLDNRGNQNPGAHESSRPFIVHIATIIAPQEASDPFWMELDAQEPPLEVRDGGLWPREINLLTTKETAEDVYRNYVPATDTFFGWRVIFDHENLSYTDIGDATTALTALDDELNDILDAEDGEEFGFRYHTALVEYDTNDRENDRGILQDYARKQRVNNVPFALLLCQVGGLVLFFLIVTAALVRRSERREIAMLQSRGAWESHIMALRGIEALIICVAGALLAPLLARQLLLFLGPIIANTDNLPLPLTGSVFLFSSIAAFLTFIALTLSILPVLRLPLISAGGAALRSSTQTWFQKYYVDVVMAVLGLMFLYMLLDRETPLFSTSLGEQQVDYFLLVAPILLLIGLGIFALRLFPILAALVATLMSKGRGLINAMASWQLSREPIHYGRITFLLALAISIGWFATSFRATVRRSQVDQAQYLVGTDVRLHERDTRVRADRAHEPEFYLDHPEIDAVSLAHRVPNITYVNSEGLQPVDMLAIDPRTFGDVSLDYWRSDLGSIVVPYAPNAEVDLPVVGEALPFTPTTVGMWTRLDRLTNILAANTNYAPDLARLSRNVEISLRLLDDAGTWIIVPFEVIRAEYLRTGEDSPGFETAAHVTSGWIYFEADLRALEYEPQGDVRLVSIFWEHRANNNNGERGIRLLMADFTLFDAKGDPTRFAIDEGSWQFVSDAGAQTESGPEDIRPAATIIDDPGFHEDILSVRFDQFALWARMGINLNYPDLPVLEAVVSETMGESLGLILPEGETRTVGQETPEEAVFTFDNVHGIGVTMRTQPDSVTEYFPSLYDDDDGFVIVDIRELLYKINQRPSASIYADEAWLKFSEGTTNISAANAIISDLSDEQSNFTVIDEVTYAEEFDQLETDPLALGLLGLMFLAFIIALALSIVGLLTYTALTAQARRSEFGVLRALGLPSMRVVNTLLFEQIFVVVVAAVLGSLLGFLLSVAVVPTLALGTTGEGVTPPFITETEWSAIGNFGLIMAAVLVGVFAVAFFLIRQLSLSRSLRLGDE